MVAINENEIKLLPTKYRNERRKKERKNLESRQTRFLSQFEKDIWPLLRHWVSQNDSTRRLKKF